MEKVVFDRSTGNKFFQMLGISKERLIDLDAHQEKCLKRLFRETKENGSIGFESTRVIEEFVKGAETEGELVYLAAEGAKTILEFKEMQEELIPEPLMEIIQKLSKAQHKEPAQS